MKTRQDIKRRTTPIALLVLLFSLFLTSSATAATTTLYAIQDTYVSSMFPGTSFPGDMLRSGSGQNLLAEFDISSIPASATINSATLKLYVADYSGDIPPAKNFRATEINAAWSDAAATWISNPPSGITGPVTTIGALVGDHAWDVTAMVTGWHSGVPNNGIKLVPETSSPPAYTIIVHSLESDAGKAPRLIIDYSEQGQNNITSDLGDAPDSSNHHAVANTAYPAIGVNGAFPTVYDSPISGPLHADARPARLGNFATGEVEADGGADLDGVNNIMTGGADIANDDNGDDGWLNPNVPIIDCQRSALQVRVSKHNSLPTPNQMYLNVYFDGNRDGDWQDTTQCPPDPLGIARPGYEWMVQDFVVDMTAIPAGGFNDIIINSVNALNYAPNKAHWMRFTLSEMPTGGYVPAGILPDGRGPQQPGHFQVGETEDYIQIPDPQGAPGQIELHKGIDDLAPGGVVLQPGDVFTWTIRAEHVGGTANAATTISDTLPAGIELAGTPTVSEEAPSVSPLSAAISGKTITWIGGLTPGGKVRIDIPVKVSNCFGLNDRSITNKATAIQTDGSPIEATSTVVVDCIDLIFGHLELDASLFDRLSVGSRAVGESVGFGRIGLRIEMRNDHSEALQFNLDVKSGLLSLDEPTLSWEGCLTCTRGTEDRTASSVPRNAGGESETWSVTLEPGEVRTFEAVYELSEDVDDGTELPFDINVCRGVQGLCGNLEDSSSDEYLEFPQVVWEYNKRDLGDAPDSSNHFATPMSAYSGVPANFPTVFDPATGVPSGPSHVHPQPFHLGQRVSHEVEADIGPDQDPVNNIDPIANISDRDRFDDGVRPDLWVLNNCQPTTIDVQVFIHPNALAWFNENDQTQGFLNVWLDSNRDGDWADWGQCPNDPQYQFNEATEHIVINHAINVATLGAGLHTVTIGTHRVLWPAAQANAPVWARVTLATREAPLPHTTGNGTAYGDGRSDGTSYMMGETEDYLRYADQGVADVGVKKEGQIRTELDAAGNIVAKIRWSIKYANTSSLAASNVVVKDTLQPGQTVVNIVATNPAILPPTVSGDMLTFNVGTLLPGESGTILIETEIVGAAAGLQVGNLVEISAETDSDPSNNSDVAGVVLQLRAPLITNPLPGTTCDNVVVMDGVSMPGTTVDLYVDGVLLGNYPTDGAGNWGVTTTLADGTHTVHAIAKIGATSSAPSAAVTFIVDSTLPYSPMTFALTDVDTGETRYPADSSGRYDGVDPQVMLRPFTEYTVTIKICCFADYIDVTLEINGVGLITLTDPDGDDYYTGTFTTGNPASLTSPTLTLTIFCDMTVYIVTGGVVLIDPAGVVYDAIDGALQEDAVVTLSEDVGGSFIEWPAAAFGQVNPQTTLTDGWFSFFTPQGTYRLNVEKDGYQPYVSTDIEVIDQLVIYNVPLTRVVAEDADYVIYIDEDGFDQISLEIQVGDVVEFVNLNLDGGTATSNSPVLGPNSRNVDGFDSGLLDAGESHKVVFTSAGTFEYVDSTDEANLALIMVTASAPTAVALTGAATALSSTTVLAALLAMALGGTAVVVRKR